MCWQDLAISRLKKSRTQIINTTGTVPADGKRVLLRVATSSNDMVTISVNTGTSQIILGHCGIFTPAANTVTWSDHFQVTIDDIGDLIYSQFTVTSFIGSDISVLEVWMDDPPQVTKEVRSLQ